MNKKLIWYGLIIICLLYTDNCPPVNLDSLLVQLRPQVGPKWYQFGEAAGIENDALDKFVEQCAPEECIVELFDYWLRNSVENPTWRDIAKILKTIGLAELGLSIESIYTTGINLVITRDEYQFYIVYLIQEHYQLKLT